MKEKRNALFCVLVFSAFLLIISISFLFPVQQYSVYEKRYLSSFPALDAETILTGKFGEKIESYMADHLPLRTFWIGLNSYFEYVSGRQASKEIIIGKSGRLYERPSVWDEKKVTANIDSLNRFADTVGKQIDLILIPSAGFVLQDDIPPFTDHYSDGEMIDQIYAMAGDGIQTYDAVSWLNSFADRDELYYSTDHHWTSKGAYIACKNYTISKGLSPLPADSYRITEVSGFYGSTYARSSLWLHKSENIEIWESSSQLTVTASDISGSHDGVFFFEQLDSGDMYTVFLGGNHPLVRIENSDSGNDRQLLVIRDSFANCGGCFLANSYQTVVLADLRYYKYPISELIETEEFDDILVLYSLSSFLSEQDLLWLE